VGSTVAALREHRRRQLEDRLIAGGAYDDQRLVFAQEDGTPLPPKRITKTFTRLVVRAELPALTVHGLRHSWATLALGSGAPLKVVSDMLGHSSVAITGDVYSHVTETMAADAAAAVAGLIDGR
jgi:integrase